MKFVGWIGLSVLVNIGLFGWMRTLVGDAESEPRMLSEAPAKVQLVQFDKLPPPRPPEPEKRTSRPKLTELSVPASIPSMAQPVMAFTPARSAQGPSTPVVARPHLGPVSVKGRMVTGPARPAAGLGTGGTGKGSAGTTMKRMVRGAPEPTLKVPPRYPPSALREGIEGWVKVSFVIDRRGRPTKVRVHSSKPEEVFDTAAVRAVRKWSYPKQVQEISATVTLEFKVQGGQ